MPRIALAGPVFVDPSSYNQASTFNFMSSDRRERPGSSAILTSRQNALQPTYILRAQQAVFKKVGIALLKVQSIEKKHETDHEHNREQCKIPGHRLVPVVVCRQDPLCNSTRGSTAVLPDLLSNRMLKKGFTTKTALRHNV
jgi:hypothetical protein